MDIPSLVKLVRGLFKRTEFDFERECAISLRESTHEFNRLSKYFKDKKMSLNAIKYTCLIQCIWKILAAMCRDVSAKLTAKFIHNLTGDSVSLEFVEGELKTQSKMARGISYYQYIMTNKNFSDIVTADFQQQLHFVLFFAAFLFQLDNASPVLESVVKHMSTQKLKSKHDVVFRKDEKADSITGMLDRNSDVCFSPLLWTITADSAMYILACHASYQSKPWVTEIWPLYLYTFESFDLDESFSPHEHHRHTFDPISYCGICHRILLVPYIAVQQPIK